METLDCTNPVPVVGALREKSKPTPGQTCGDCDRYLRPAWREWGYCLAHLPAWAADHASPDIYPGDSMADGCRMFEPDSEAEHGG